MAHILVTGATGMLAATLVPALKSAGHQVTRHGHRNAADINADLCDLNSTMVMLLSLAPDCVINLVAMTDVDNCEVEPNQAYLVNVKSVQNLAKAISLSAKNCHLIHISTDQLYDGSGPHVEGRIQLKNYYAFSKMAAEMAAATVPASILRTNFFGPSQCLGRRSFSDWLQSSLRQGQVISVFEDVLFSPLSMHSLSQMIAQVVCQRPIGVFNLGSANGMSKADFAFAFAAVLKLPTASMQRSQSSDRHSLKAYRPKDMRMSSHKFEHRMGLVLPTLTDEISSMQEAYFETA